MKQLRETIFASLSCFKKFVYPVSSFRKTVPNLQTRCHLFVVPQLVSKKMITKNNRFFLIKYNFAYFCKDNF